MSKIFISYGGDNFTKLLKRIDSEAKSLNRFDKIILYECGLHFAERFTAMGTI